MILKKLILPLLAASMFGATQSGGLAVQESITNAPASVKKDSVNGIYYSLHIVWEGLEVEDYHIKKLEKFRGEHPDISVIHHVSPLYATSAMSRYNLKKNLEKVFRKGDQMGVYISGWKSVVEEAGVKFRSENSFWGNKLREDCTVCGSEIPITSYTKSELEKIIEWSVEEVDDLGFGTPNSSFIAGWQSSPEILGILSDNGIKIDFSMVAPYRTEQTLKYQNIYQHLLDFWGYRTESLAPIAREFEEQKIFQIPNNFAHPGIIPYKKAKSLLKQVFSAINRDTYNGSTVSLMISQNRLYSDLPQVEEFTKEIFKQSIENKIDFNLLVNSPIYLDPESVKLSKAGTWAWPNLSVNNLKAKF